MQDSSWLSNGIRLHASLSLNSTLQVLVETRVGEVCLDKEPLKGACLLKCTSAAAMKRCLNICPTAAKVHQPGLPAN